MKMKKRLYTKAKSVAAWIKSTLDVSYIPEGVMDLLDRIGYTCGKTKEIPCACNIEEPFAKELSELFDGMDDGSAVYDADGVYPTHNSRSTDAWIEKGENIEQSTVGGQDRVNINGTVNAKDAADVIAVDGSRVNAQAAKELYRLALDRHLQAKKIYIISDNAKYYKNATLKQWIQRTKITQIFLPPYFPNLNLINTYFYRNKEIFREAINSFFKNIAAYKSELETPADSKVPADKFASHFWEGYNLNEQNFKECFVINQF